MQHRRPPGTNNGCSSCQLATLCLPADLDANLVALLAQWIQGLPPQERGECLYRQGEPRQSLFVLRSGLAKAVDLGPDGYEEVIAFHYPGDLIGIGSLHRADYADTVVLLERASVCEIPAETVDRISVEHPALQRLYIDRLAAEVAALRHSRLRLTHAAASERVADFLLEVRARMRVLRRSPDVFRLTMSRHEIGSYLGLAAETVSRTMKSFEAEGVVRLRGKQTTLVDVPALEARARRLARSGWADRAGLVPREDEADLRLGLAS